MPGPLTFDLNAARAREGISDALGARPQQPQMMQPQMMPPQMMQPPGMNPRLGAPPAPNFGAQPMAPQQSPTGAVFGGPTQFMQSLPPQAQQMAQRMPQPWGQPPQFGPQRQPLNPQQFLQQFMSQMPQGSPARQAQLNPQLLQMLQRYGQ